MGLGVSVSVADERRERARADLARAGFVLADLDGTLIFGDRPAAGAPDLVHHFAGRIAVVSNYSTVTATEMAARLTAIDLPVEADRIFLAGEMMVRHVAALTPGARTLCAMTGSMRQLATELGLRLVDENPDVLLVGRDLDLTYGRLAAAMAAVHSGATVYASNLDRSHPGIGSRPVPETGSLIRAITAAAPETIVHVIGKPDRRLFRAALEALGGQPEDAVMLGDNPETDIAGARALGIRPILIGPSADADIAHLAEIVPADWRLK